MTVQGRPKTLPEAKQWLHDKLAAGVHPMNALDPVKGSRLIERLTGLDGDSWAKVWGTAGDAAREQARNAEVAGRDGEAEALYREASGLYFLGRFPCPNHPAKLRCAELERSTYLASARYWKFPAVRVSVPFDGRPGEGSEVICLLRVPDVSRPPVAVIWGGVDACKEQMTAVSNALLARGIATLAMDNAGTGESPVRGVPDAERQFLAVFDWLLQREDLDARQVSCLGRSFGGYWATKLAHQVPERIVAAVNWGGGAHYMFQREWIEASRYPDSYLMELVETRCRMLGATNDEEYLAFFERLSLLDQGWLDKPSAPLLLVNGKDDRQCPVRDIELLTLHGTPKSVRLFPGGHMGLTPQTLPTIVEWLVSRIRNAGSLS
ncbi:MAG: alpha/beta fold hydrolase [Pseudomonadota bacterium]